jgi:mitogen-activated protein kinase organizer 1
MATPPTLPTHPLHILTTHGTSPINALTFSAKGGTYILTGSSDRQIHLCRSVPTSTASLKTNKITTRSFNGTHEVVESTLPIQKYAAHGYAVLDIACSGDNTQFVSVGGDRVVFLWDVTRAETSRRFGGNTDQGHTARINAVAFAGGNDTSEGGGETLILSGSDDRTVRLWDLRSKDTRPLQVWGEARDGVSSIEVLRHTSGEVLVGSTDGRVRSYDVRMGAVTVDTMPGAVTHVRATGDGGAMLVGCLQDQESRIRLIDRRDGNCLRGFGGDGDIEYRSSELRLRCTFGKNEGIVLSGSEGDGRVRAWGVLSGKVLGSVDVSEKGSVVSCVEWRKGGAERNVWAAGAADGKVIVFGEA